MEAVHRAVQGFGDKCDMNTNTICMLSMKFSNRGFVKYETRALDHDQEFDSMLYKKTFGGTTKDWGVWAFHGDLPLLDCEDGDVLVETERIA